MVIVDEDKIVKTPLVSVRVHSYNQEQFIEQCLDSILSQITSFEYEIILSNNPSEDHTRDICIKYQKEHPDKIRLLLREKNVGFFANFFETGSMCRGKYIARCDADDYWCDNYKLQKQVDVLDSDETIGLCYTRSKVLYENTKKIEDAKSYPYMGFEAHLLSEHIMTLTVMHRRDLYNKYLEEIHPQDKGWLMEDSPISLWYSKNSRMKGLDDITSVYRYVDNSISHPVDYSKMEAFNQSLLDIRMFFYERYHVNNSKLKRELQNDFRSRNMEAAYNSGMVDKYVSNLLSYKGFHPYAFAIYSYRFFKLLVKKLIK